MATRRPSKQAKAENALAKLAEEMGGKLDISSLLKVREHTSVNQTGANREAESVLRSLHQPHLYTMKTCKRAGCGEVFQTNYCAVGYCSDACLVADFREIGIHYDPYRLKRYESSMYSSTSGMVYRYEPPEYIPSQTLDNLEQVFTAFLADITRLRGHSLEVEEQQNQENLAKSQRELDVFFDDSVETDASLDSPLVPQLLLQDPSTEDDEVLASHPESHQQQDDILALFG